ncbi:hypothetical protein ACFXTH_035540 [Malus domestica]
MNPFPTVRQAYASIFQEEKQRSLASSRVTTGTAGMAMRQSGSKSSNRKPLHCTHCDQDYHTIDTCYQLHGYPSGHRLHKVKPQKGNHRPKTEWGFSSFQQILHIMNGQGNDEQPQANAAKTRPNDEDDDWFG